MALEAQASTIPTSLLLLIESTPARCLLSTNTLLLQLHRYGIPLDDLLLQVAVVSRQCWSCCPESKLSIFNDRFIRPDRIEEVCEVILVVAITFRCFEND